MGHVQVDQSLAVVVVVHIFVLVSSRSLLATAGQPEVEFVLASVSVALLFLQDSPHAQFRTWRARRLTFVWSVSVNLSGFLYQPAHPFQVH